MLVSVETERFEQFTNYLLINRAKWSQVQIADSSYEQSEYAYWTAFDPEE